MERWKLARIEHLRCAWVILVGGAGGTPALPDLLSRPLQYLFVRRVLPLYQLLDQSEKSLAFLLLRLFGWKQIWVRRRIVHHLGENDCPRCCQRSSRPPQVQRAGVTVADGLLSRTGFVDCIQWQGNFDEFLLWGHAGSTFAVMLAAPPALVTPRRHSSRSSRQSPAHAGRGGAHSARGAHHRAGTRQWRE